MKYQTNLKNFMLICLLPTGMLLFYISSFVPGFVERIYSESAYKLAAQVLSNITGLLPFSIAEFVLISLILFVLFKFIQTMLKLARSRTERQTIIFSFLKNIFIYISIIYFGFVAVWGLNYNRLPFSAIISLDVTPASVTDLEKLCEFLIERTNKIRESVHENQSGIAFLPNGISETFKSAADGFESISSSYPVLGGKYGNAKGIYLSHLMSYTGITGVYFPFTGEANVNTAIPGFMIPSTTCHEMAHQRGFSREDEANYIAYLVCDSHADADFQYSGNLLALIYSMNALYQYDKDKFSQLTDRYSSGVIRDLCYNSQFWEKYEGPVEKLSTEINNTYLKANGQKDGVHSYGRMVDLLIARYKKSGG